MKFGQRLLLNGIRSLKADRKSECVALVAVTHTKDMERFTDQATGFAKNDAAHEAACDAANDQAAKHTTDADCTVGPDGCCVVCGVDHGGRCDICGGRGFHKTGCPDSDEMTLEQAESLLGGILCKDWDRLPASIRGLADSAISEARRGRFQAAQACVGIVMDQIEAHYPDPDRCPEGVAQVHQAMEIVDEIVGGRRDAK